MWKRGEYKEHSIEEAVEYCAAILPVFEKAGIPVIRLGLNPTDDLSGGDAVGGAYHPALGEMVRSRLIYEKISKLINESIDAESLTVGVNPRSISQAVGQKRCNIEKAKQDFGVELKVVPDENIPVGEVEFE
jgi:histone acetyltransferase (RNA polymerase elongator complex component)